MGAGICDMGDEMWPWMGSVRPYQAAKLGAAGNGEGEHVATPKSWKWLISPGRVKCFSCPQQIWRQRLRACMDKHVGDHVVKREARSA